MIIDLQIYLASLKERHGTITVAVCQLGDQAHAGTPDGIMAIQLLNDRMVYATYGDAQALEYFLAKNHVAPGWWIQLREYDEYIPKHHQPQLEELEGDLVEVQMGALDQMFGYVAVQTRQLKHLDEVFDRVQRELANEPRPLDGDM